MNSLDIVGIRLVKERSILSDTKISTPSEAIQVLANELQFLDREVMMSVNLNNHNQIINATLISMGSINRSLIDPKSIFKSSLLSNASNIMLIHNHPSGDCSPSTEDLKLTDIIEKDCKILDINLLDHIIVGKDKYYSIKMNEEATIENDLAIENDIEL